MQYVPKVHFEQIPIRNLVSNQEYQRNLSQNHVQRAAANFDLYQINPVKVSRRNGINYVFNGQHTIEIVALVSGSRETPVWCMVYDDLVYEHEADIFANQMKYVKPLLPYEIFMANIEAGNDKQLIIRDLVESYDLSITSSSVPGGICAVATLETIHDKYGYHMLDHVIRLIVATWEGAAQSFSANMMNGLARFLNAYGDAVKDDIFKEKLGRISIKELSRTAKDRRSGSLGFAEAILIGYNKKCRNPLPWDKLYTHKLPQKKADEPELEEETDDMPQNGQLDLFGLGDDEEGFRMIIRKPLPCCLPKMQTHISLHRILLFLPKQAVRLQEHTAEVVRFRLLPSSAPPLSSQAESHLISWNSIFLYAFPVHRPID